MRTSAPGNKPPRGFTLIEVMVVMAIIAIGVGLAALALRDGDASRLEEEAARLSALLDGARAEARVLGLDVRWLPYREPTAEQPQPGFSFQGLPPGDAPRPSAWLHAQTQAQVVGAPALRLGPEPVIGAQRVMLRLGEQQMLIATDGLAPFHIETAAADTP